MTKRVKACKLPITTKIRIGQYKEENSAVPIIDIAKRFNCTYQQARTAYQDWKNGKLSKPGKAKKKKTIQSPAPDEQDKPIENKLDSLLQTAVNELENAKDMEVETKILLLNKIFDMKKKSQSITLANHLRRADADILAVIIRRYEPGASDDRIIEIYHEAETIIRSQNVP